jgi:hypothetical protein
MMKQTPMTHPLSFEGDELRTSLSASVRLALHRMPLSNDSRWSELGFSSASLFKRLSIEPFDT